MADTTFTITVNFSENLQLQNESAMVDSVDLETFCSGLGGGSSNSSMCAPSGPGVSMVSPVCMFITGVLGNILALIVLHTTRRELKKTPYFVLLLGLAWSDLASQLMTSPVTISVYANNLQWRGGKPVCVYSAFVMIAFGIILPLLVCCLSIERVLALRLTYLYARVVTVSRAKWAFLVCWLYVITFCTFPLIGFGSYEHQYPGTWCFLNFHNESASDAAYASVFAIFNISIILVIVVCNVTVVLTLLRMRKSRRHKHSPQMDRRADVPRKSLLQMEMETQMVWFLCAVTIVFVTCWLPLNVIILRNTATGAVKYRTDLTVIRLASINQILDPWLYILLRKSVLMKIKSCVKRLFKCGQNLNNIKHLSGRLTDVHRNGAVHKTEIPMEFTEHRDSLVLTNGTIQGRQTSTDVYVTCEQNADKLDCDKSSSECESSDSDIFLDSNSSRCFPTVFVSDKPRRSSGYFSFGRRLFSTGDNPANRHGSMRDNSARGLTTEDRSHKTVCRILSLPTNIKT